MSDFLSNLALRSLRPATAPALLQPRLPSLFESPGGPEQIAVPPSESEVERQVAPRKGPIAPILLSVIEKPKAAPLLVEPQRTILHPRERAATLNAASVTKEMNPPAPPTSAGTPQDEPAPVNEMKAKREPRLVERSPESQRQDRPDDHSSHPRAELVPTSPQSKLSLALPVMTSVLRPGLTESERVVEQAPIVQIRIGRIEVRAITPAPVSPSRPAHRSPKLTLDDYLRQRNEGKR